MINLLEENSLNKTERSDLLNGTKVQFAANAFTLESFNLEVLKNDRKKATFRIFFGMRASCSTLTLLKSEFCCHSTLPVSPSFIRIQLLLEKISSKNKTLKLTVGNHPK